MESGHLFCDDVESRAGRAEALVHMGEFSAARQALEGAALAPGTDATLAMLQNPLRRLPSLRDPILKTFWKWGQ